MNVSSEFEDVRNKIIRIKEDSLAKLLMKNSHLTEIQLETFLIDIMAEDLIEKKMGYEEKSKIRLNKIKISRGAFNRTLKQAKTNIFNSIYTIFLLGYLGILDSPTLNPFIETSNKLKGYIEIYNNVWEELKKKPVDKNKLESVSLLRKELESSLFDLLSFKIITKAL